jgi:hypothetical protein
MPTVVLPSFRSTSPPSASDFANADSFSAACWRVSDSFSSTFMSDMGAPSVPGSAAATVMCRSMVVIIPRG